MKIFLINPEGLAKFPASHYGLQLIATILDQHGYKNIIDIDFNKGDNPYAYDYTGGKVVAGITVTFMTILEGFNLAKFVKEKNPKATIVFGGPQVTLMPGESIQNEHVDMISIGEGLYTMLEIVQRLDEGRCVEGVPGVWYKNEKGEVIKNKPRDFVKDLDTIPFSNRKYFQEKDYQEYFTNWLRRTVLRTPVQWGIMASQGCPYKCRMCQPALKMIAGGYRLRSVENVTAEIRELKEKYGATVISFGDNDLGINRKWMKALCEELKKIPGINLTCNVRANLMDWEILNLMKESGFTQISFGAESGNDRVLKEIVIIKIPLIGLFQIERA